MTYYTSTLLLTLHHEVTSLGMNCETLPSSLHVYVQELTIPISLRRMQ